ncbi:sodium:solute symporter family transporter [Qipengyuania zhejiangensis]|uniref:sodium:solute symporter family transporter n=1 Tax=Qipengyuania zhejiangensis TaxID=3077782 RepID=UPI002D7836EF|nr:sodium/solute symporter [Qipengyuania sp. Z2]
MYDTANFGSAIQLIVFAGLTAFVGVLTWWKVRSARRDGSEKDVYLAGKGLTWFFVAGSITLTNLSTDQLVGMNGNQMLLLAWWEIAGFVGLMALAFVFVPLYYRYNCTTVTELLERRYDGRSIRTLISGIFLAGNILIYLPAALYSGGLFLQSLFGTGIPLIVFSVGLALIGAAYTIFGGLRAVAVMDTFSGIGILFLALVIVFLALAAVDFDIVTGVPPERLTMVGATDSPIPFHTLFTGMAFIQIFYWSTNQNITQKAMAAPNVKEAQKGVFVAAAIRILVVPPIVVVPGVVAYKLFGDVGDAAYGRLVAEVLPSWLSGAFAAMVAAAVITTFSAVLNSTVALYSVDFHEQFVGKVQNHWKLGAVMSTLATAMAIMLVPMYQNADSIINLLQQLNGLSSMPILSAFIVGLLFRNVAARSAIAGVVWGIGLYAAYTFNDGFSGAVGLHYIDFMVITLFTSVAAALAFNRVALGRRAEWIGLALFRGAEEERARA